LGFFFQSSKLFFIGNSIAKADDFSLLFIYIFFLRLAGTYAGTSIDGLSIFLFLMPAKYFFARRLSFCGD
jgi:hypothetical protein